MSTMTAEREPATAEDPRWAKIVARDPRADGIFWYSVATTGVYCMPSCPARLANPKNVRFHADIADARACGFRPCRRCRPDEPPLQERRAELIAQACRAIEEAENPPSLAALAKQAGLSPGYFHRLFAAVTGLTPRAYAAARRADNLRKELGRSQTVTTAIYDAGFNATSRFYEKSAEILGMTPRQFRDGAGDLKLRFAVGQCSLGAILVAATDKGVCAVFLGDDPEKLLRDLQDQFPNASLSGGDAAFEALVAQVVGFVEAPAIGLDLPLDIRGTSFQCRVWAALRQIQPGQTLTYSEVAARIGQPKAVRAVASACAANRLAVAIPCHRVIRNDGSLSGYRWGISRKRDLLTREGLSPAAE